MDEVRLTERQRQILCRATWTNRQIAMNLGITQQTVKNHFTRIYRLLLGPARYRAPRYERVQALVHALKCGLIEFEDIVTYRKPSWWPKGG